MPPEVPPLAHRPPGPPPIRVGDFILIPRAVADHERRIPTSTVGVVVDVSVFGTYAVDFGPYTPDRPIWLHPEQVARLALLNAPDAIIGCNVIDLVRSSAPLIWEVGTPPAGLRHHVRAANSNGSRN